jgi:uncharacterized protein
MNKDLILEKCRKYVRSVLEGEGSGHDWWHIVRVVNNALNITKEENGDPFIIELAALLHDIGDHKLHGGKTGMEKILIPQFLENFEISKELSDTVVRIVSEVSYKGAGVETPVSSIESAIVQDADRLDAIGAIGIARTFAYGGAKSREIYNPDIKPEMHDSFENYKSGTAPTINHFYEKLLLLKDRMNTDSAKKIAQERHTYMQSFLEQFYSEWEGNA